MLKLTVKSSAFEHNQLIPAKYTCDGDEVNPPLTVTDVPLGTKTLALIVDDPDAVGSMFDHWIVWNIPPTGKIEERSIPGTEGLNSDRQGSYIGMCPPWGTHRYFFKVYALDIELSLNPNAAGKKELEKAMQGHTLAKGELIGLYNRSR